MMNVAVAGATGYLGKPVVEKLLSLKSNVLSLGAKPATADLLHHPNFMHHETEISADSQITIFFEEFTSIHGPIDGLLILTSRSARGLETDNQGDTFSNNLILGIEPTRKLLLESRRFLNLGASVVVVSSLWARRIPEPAMYLDLGNEPALSVPATKAAQLQLARYFAVLWARDQIRINLLTPGWFPRPGPVERHDYISEITRRTPMGRIGQPTDLVDPILFLLGKGSSFITGQELVVDGGYSLW